MLSIRFRAMNCAMSAMLDEVDEHDVALQALLAEVPTWFEAWEQCLSRFRADSELAQLNAHTGQAVVVSDTLWAVLRSALEVAAMSDGLVTPTVLADVEAMGYAVSFERMDGTLLQQENPQQHDNTASPAWQAIRMDASHQSVTLPAGVRLDLAGVAKGWCAEQAAHRLMQRSGAPVLVDAGGDIVAAHPQGLDAEAQGAAGWGVAIAAPILHQDATQTDATFGNSPSSMSWSDTADTDEDGFADEVDEEDDDDEDMAIIHLTHGALATSGRDVRRWPLAGQERHHIIDPRTGQSSVANIISASVLAPTMLLAEAGAKILMILGWEAGLQHMQHMHPKAMWAECGLCAVLEDGSFVANELMEAKSL